MNLILYDNRLVPVHVSQGFHSQYIIPTAQKFCIGEGVDVGPNREEWKFPGAIGIDANFPKPFNDAMNLPFPAQSLPFCYSSHCLEHLPNYIAALEEWKRVIKPGGHLFLYLPSTTCDHNRCIRNRKHLHEFTPEQIRNDLFDLGFENVFVSGVDLSWSFAAVAEKPANKSC